MHYRYRFLSRILHINQERRPHKGRLAGCCNRSRWESMNPPALHTMKALGRGLSSEPIYCTVRFVRMEVERAAATAQQLLLIQRYKQHCLSFASTWTSLGLVDPSPFSMALLLQAWDCGNRMVKSFPLSVPLILLAAITST